jgi:GNAT superfamily N-acetyltransferase
MTTIRRIVTGDRAAWGKLYAGYAEFYGVDQTEEMRDRVWSWLHIPSHELEGFVAVHDGRLVGLAHVRAFARPLSASIGGYIDDLFVVPEARGRGVAEALIGAVAEDGRRRGWTLLRWITAEDNARARKVYDRVGRATRWITYDVALP